MLCLLDSLIRRYAGDGDERLNVGGTAPPEENAQKDNKKRWLNY